MISASHLDDNPLVTDVKKCWLSDYAPEVYTYMREVEQRWMTFGARSPQLSYRRDLVNFVTEVCNNMGFGILTEHLSVHLLDLIMDGHDIGVGQLQQLALGCILVAGKVEERESRIPYIHQICELMKKIYNDEDLARAERKVLLFFDWDILHPTTAHFLDYFAVFAIAPCDLPSHAPDQRKGDRLYKEMQSYLSYFLATALKDYTFKYMPPSLVAAACVVTSRMCLNLAPIWPPTLQLVSAYTMDQVRYCTNHLLMAKDREEAETGVSSIPVEAAEDADAIGFQSHEAIMATAD